MLLARASTCILQRNFYFVGGIQLKVCSLETVAFQPKANNINVQLILSFQF